MRRLRAWWRALLEDTKPDADEQELYDYHEHLLGEHHHDALFGANR